MPASYTLPLSDPMATLETAGGKGASLARMRAAGLPVPDGFHVSTAAYRRFVDENGLTPRILAALAPVATDKPATLESASQAIRELFARGTIPSDVAAAVVHAYGQLAGTSPAVAVRSSATAEDLPEASFAGQQETFLNVSGADDVLEAVRRCWASLWTARAIGYRARQGIAPEDVALAVVVQLLVPAEAAGILFTANPVTGDRSQAVISAAWGLGEAVVGGLVTPDALTVDKASGQVIEHEIADKPVMIVRVDGGTQEQPVPETLRRQPVLNDKTIADLVRLGKEIEQLYAIPMDVEWALADDQIAIVQARPITALPRHEPAPPTEWRLPDPKAWYARGSLCEHLPDPVSPLFATMGVRLANQSLGEMVGVLGSVDIDAAQLGYNYSVINGYLYLSTKLGLREIWGYLKVTINGLGMILRRGTERWQEGRATLQKTTSRWAAQVPATLAPRELLDGSRELLLEAMRFYTVIQAGTLPTATSSETVFKRVCKLMSREDDPDPTVFLFGFDTVPIQAEKSLYDLAVWAAGETDLRAYLLSTATEDLVAQLQNADAPTDVRAEVWTAWRDRFGAHLNAYGDAVYEYDLLNPTPIEAPEPLLDAVKMYLDGQGKNPHERQQEAVERREQATAQVLARARWPFKNLFSKALGWAQRTGPVREDSLADMGMAHPQIRRLLGELGRRFVDAGAIAESDDIYWLHEQEIEQLAEQLESGAPLPAMQGPVAERKQTYESQRQLVAPAILPETSRLAKIMPWSEQRQGEEHILRGAGTSTGKVTAPACVLFGPEDFGRMKPGDVLVAVTTTPAWTPLFAMASAVVTDIGGPLSHSSIVAREYGIPAVMATGLATRRIQTGQVITVDGGAGVVLLSNGREK